MSQPKKLDMRQKHIINLIAQDRDEDGWATVSDPLYPILFTIMPARLVEIEKLENGGRVRLTIEGQGVLDAMAWL
ncbi:MAG: hypothetical protein V1800_06740 [Candidatus Latescibacterota bacterium]